MRVSPRASTPAPPSSCVTEPKVLARRNAYADRHAERLEQRLTQAVNDAMEAGAHDPILHVAISLLRGHEQRRERPEIDKAISLLRPVDGNGNASVQADLEQRFATGNIVDVDAVRTGQQLRSDVLTDQQLRTAISKRTPWGGRWPEVDANAPFAMRVALSCAPQSQRSWRLQLALAAAPPLHPRNARTSPDQRPFEFGWSQRLRAAANPARVLSPAELVPWWLLQAILNMYEPDGSCKPPKKDDGNGKPFPLRQRLLTARHQRLFEKEAVANVELTMEYADVAPASLRADLHNDEKATADGAEAAGSESGGSLEEWHASVLSTMRTRRAEADAATVMEKDARARATELKAALAEAEVPLLEAEKGIWGLNVRVRLPAIKHTEPLPHPRGLSLCSSRPHVPSSVRQDIDKLKSSKSPPAGAVDVSAAAILMVQTKEMAADDVDVSWKAAQQMMTPPVKFVQLMQDFKSRVDCGDVPKSNFTNLKPLLKLANFSCEAMQRICAPAAGLADFLQKMNSYYELNERLSIVPMRLAAKNAAATLEAVTALKVAALAAKKHAEDAVAQLSTKAYNAAKAEKKAALVEAERDVAVAAHLVHVSTLLVDERRAQACSPAKDDAEAALAAIKIGDMGVLKQLKMPPDLVRRVFDAVLILFQKELVPSHEETIETKRGPVLQLQGSWQFALPMMTKIDFVDSLLNLNKDAVNDETVELLYPYLAAPDFTPDDARQVAGALADLCTWARTMALYVDSCRNLTPQREALGAAHRQLDAANSKLARARRQLAQAQRRPMEFGGAAELLQELTPTCARARALEQRVLVARAHGPHVPSRHAHCVRVAPASPLSLLARALALPSQAAAGCYRGRCRDGRAARCGGEAALTLAAHGRRDARR